MKIDMEKWEQMGCPFIEIYLNNTQMSHCVEADDKGGWVKVQRADWWEKGMSHIPTQQLYGDVEIRIVG